MNDAEQSIIQSKWIDYDSCIDYKKYYDIMMEEMYKYMKYQQEQGYFYQKKTLNKNIKIL
jgi:hypothetical protein